MSKDIDKKIMIKGKIDNLRVPAEAKDVLLRTLNVAKSENRTIKEAVKSLFVICPSGAGISDYARQYEEILDENEVYPVKGKVSYLELAFPNTGSEEDFEKFFQSPRIAATTLNAYAGVMLVSFEQWTGFNELSRDPVFPRFVRFIEENIRNIHYVFHVLPSFDDSDMLREVLNGHINLMDVILTNPDVAEATEYVQSSLEKTGIMLDTSAKDQFGELISRCVNLESDSFHGKKTLDRFTDNLLFEMTSLFDVSNEEMVIDEHMIHKIEENLDFNLDENKGYKKMGFM